MKIYLLNLVSLISSFSAISQPFIDSFSPESGAIGTSVTISGSGFSNVALDNIVFFGAVRGTVLTASVNSLTVQVPAGASYDLMTVTVGQLMAYSKKPFSVTFTVTNMNAASFSTKTDISAPTNGPSVTLFKDLDNDGKPELIYGSSGFSFHKNNSTPGIISFGPQNTFAATNFPNYIAIEDMDGDGKPDVIVPDYSQPVRIYKNLSSGGIISMSAPVTIATTGSAFAVGTQDLDGDGRPDLVTTNNDVPGKLTIYRNTSSAGNISLTLIGDYATASSYPRGVSFGYLNADDQPDMIIANQYGTSVSIFVNTSTPGNISFAPYQNLSVPADSYPESISVGDFDGDGKDDIAVADNNLATMGTVSVFKNIGSGTTVSFAPALNLTTGSSWNPYRVSVGDLDGDGKPEIAVSNQTNNAVSIFKNNSIPGTLSFDVKFDLQREGNPSRSSMLISDVDGDGRPDIISGSQSPVLVTIFSNTLSVLPVKFVSFTAVKTNNDVLLKWLVENETDQTDRYEIERSFTGTSFNKLTAIQKNPGGIGQSYHFTDLNVALPYVKNIYYRVKQVDKDGKETYTEIRRLNTEQEKEIYITVYPNPVNDIAVVNIFLSAAENISFSISDVTGKVVRTKTSINALDGPNKKLIDMGGLKAGIYYIKINAQNISRTVSIIKTNN